MIGGVRRSVFPATGDGVGAAVENEPGLVPVAIRMTAWAGATGVLQGRLPDGTFQPLHSDLAVSGTFALYTLTLADNVWMVLPEWVRAALASFGAWRMDSAGSEDGLVMEIAYAPLFGFR